MPIGIYPPILSSTQSAFLTSTRNYTIKFSLQNITDYSNIGHIQIRIALNNNQERTVANESLYKDGIIYKPWPYKGLTPPDQCEITINSEDLNSALAWKPDTIYKIQLRFGETDLWSSYPGTSGFAKWKQDQIDNQTFSEWSTVMVVKSISSLNPIILNGEEVKIDVTQSEQVETTTTPLFIGYCEQIDATEYIDKYIFELLDSEEELIESSDWQQHVANQQDKWRFKNILSEELKYNVRYTIVTRNGYQVSARLYTFKVSEVFLTDPLTGVKLFADDSSLYCKNNGCIKLYLDITKSFTGTLVISRSSEKNFNIYEDIKYITYNQAMFDNKNVFTDFTIESGIRYRYAIQQENSAKLRTNLLFAEDLNSSNKNKFSIDFEYSYLFHNDRQLKLKFNQRMSSFKHTVLTSKQDTLGDKYPHLVKNGYAYYAEFPVTGLISYQMDEDRTFIYCNDDGCYNADNELLIPRDKFGESNKIRNANTLSQDTVIKNYTDIDDGMYIDNNLIDNNIFVEKYFREEVELFLNNFDYKLYRSPTERNMVIVLTNVTLTPNDSLGRMIYEFNATAYEVMENTLSNLNQFGIIDIGQFQSRSKESSYNTVFGQITGLYTSAPIDIYQRIKQQEEIYLGNGNRLFLDNVDSFWIERYPKISFSNTIAELEMLQGELDIAGDKEGVQKIQQQIDEYKQLSKALDKTPTTVQLTVNGNSVLVAPDKIYNVKTPITSLVLKRSEYPIIINYVCTLRLDIDEETNVQESRDTSRIWGQISGIFSNTKKVLEYYRYDYNPGKPPLRVVTGDPPISVDSLGRVVLDNTNYNVYKTTNIFDIIEEETRHQVEIIYNVQGGFKKNDEGKWENADGTLIYRFSRLISFDIETEPNTILELGKTKESKKEIRIGPTGRYTLKPLSAEDRIEYIALKEGQYAIINYKCATEQITMKKGVSQANV